MELKKGTLAVAIAAALFVGFLLGLWYARVVDDSAFDWPATFDSLQSIATIIALIVGGIWTYALFIRGRVGETKAELRHYHQVVEHGGQRILRIGLEIENVGDVAIKSCSGHTEIALPPATVDPTQLPEESWALHRRIEHDFLGDELVIEPKEHERYWRDVLLPPDVNYVQLHSQVSCGPEQGRGLTWDETTVVDLTAPASAG